LNTNVSQGNEATLLKCDAIFHDHFFKYLLLNPMVKKMKIGQHMANTKWARIENRVFTHLITG